MTRPAVTEIFTPGSALSSWHGPAPRLRTGDEFGSYALMRHNVENAYVGVRFVAATISAPTMDVTVQVAGTGGIEWLQIFAVEDDGTPDGGVSLLLAEVFEAVTVPPNVWYTHTFHLVGGVHYNQATVESYIAAGTFTVLAFHADYILSAEPMGNAFYYSQLDVTIGGSVTYLRNHARDDGLGGNAPRNHPRTSQQKSLRNKGYR